MVWMTPDRDINEGIFGEVVGTGTKFNRRCPAVNVVHQMPTVSTCEPASNSAVTQALFPQDFF